MAFDAVGECQQRTSVRHRHFRRGGAGSGVAAIDVGCFALLRGERGHNRMLGGEVTDRVGCAGVAGERKGLAAAAAEILKAPWAARARLLHPIGAAKRIERRRGLTMRP